MAHPAPEGWAIPFVGRLRFPFQMQQHRLEAQFRLSGLELLVPGLVQSFPIFIVSNALQVGQDQSHLLCGARCFLDQE